MRLHLGVGSLAMGNHLDVVPGLHWLTKSYPHTYTHLVLRVPGYASVGRAGLRDWTLTVCMWYSV